MAKDEAQVSNPDAMSMLAVMHVDADLAILLDHVVAFVRQYVMLDEHQLWVLALWIAHTYSLESAECTPYLSVKSAEKRSGKTRLLEVLKMVVARPWFTGRVTASVLVRRLAKGLPPTLLLDETDAAFKGDRAYSETLRGVLNSGYRRGGVVSQSVKVEGDFELRDFPVFGPKALAGIGKLPETVHDRSIPIEIRRKAPHEHVERFRWRDVELEVVPLRESLEYWAAAAIPILEQARPDIPQELDDRAADVWEPLLAIADMAGGHWSMRAREAALALSAGREDDSLAVMLLRDIHALFEERRADRMGSAVIVKHLVAMEEAPWGLLRGKPLDTRSMATMLKPYGVKPRSIRMPDGHTPKGYLREYFSDAWVRYLPRAATTATTLTEDGAELTYVADVADVAAGKGTHGGIPGFRRLPRSWSFSWPWT